MDWFRGRRAWYVEAALLVAGYLLFGAARAGVDRGDPTATDNALLVERVERTVHIAVEYPLNQAMLGNPGLIYVTGYYYRLCLLAVPAILIWVYLRRPARYRYLRTVLVITTLLDLPLVFLFPESPPRFALAGVVDYMASYDILSGAGSRVARSGVNLLAAMPSMHIAWTTWCAYAVWSVLRPQRPGVAWLVWFFPALTGFVVIATGHHYVLDVAAGAVLVAAATRIARWIIAIRSAGSLEA
jgi:membrane-associated phospholipid phosphatase